MFRVFLCLPEVRLEGLQALDFRRRMGLPDGTSVSRPNGRQFWKQVDVTEGFARRFDIFQTCSWPDATPKAEWLQRGDLELSGQSIRWSDGMTNERATELALLAMLDGLCEK
jgi:hypothetical protein